MGIRFERETQACQLTLELDETWFSDHPGRVIYLRFATDGDPPENNAALISELFDREWFHFGVTVHPEADVWPILHGAPHCDADLVPLLEAALSVYFQDKRMARALRRQLKARLWRARSAS
jgi:hypothetical protein